MTEAEIYAEYKDKVFGYLRSHLGNNDTAEDLCSDVFLKICEKLDTFDESKASMSTWVFTITRNTLTDYYRTRRVTSEVPETLADGTSIEDDAEDAEALKALAAALGKLDKRERDIIVWHYYSGVTLIDIADRLGISYTYAKVLHAKALDELKKHF